MLGSMHKEDIKAALRKKFGTIAAFEKARGLPKKSVHDVLRRRPRGWVEAVIAAELALGDSAGGTQ